MLNYREMTAADNEAVAALIRDNLKQYGLDIPGTHIAYYASSFIISEDIAKAMYEGYDQHDKYIGEIVDII